MPIRINLLAESQAAEDARRRDPVKFSLWIGGFLISLVVLWILKLQLDIHFEGKARIRVESSWTALQKQYSQVITNQIKIARLEAKLAGLERLSTNRFFWGTLLDSLQRTTADGVQLSHLRGDQTYEIVAPVAGKVDKITGKTTPAIPGTSTARLSLTLEARDYNPGEQTYSKFKDALSSSDYFLAHLGQGDGFVLGALGSLTPDPQDPSKMFVVFTLKCSFPEVRRNE